jgi:hypothetical protein
MSYDPMPYLTVSVLIASLGCCLADVEILSLSANFRHSVLANSCRRSIYRHVHKTLGMPLDVYSYSLTLTAVLVRLTASFVIAVFAIRGTASLAGLAVYVAMSVLLRRRGGLGNNGSDEMLLLIMSTILLARLFNTPLCASLALVFLAAQVSLAYLTSGIVKIGQVPWRNGSSMVDLMSTETFGHRWLLAALRPSPKVAAAFATVFIFGELIGSLAPWLPFPYTVSLLGCAFAFHLAAAFVMGLNTFVLAFVATYPAVIYTSLVLYGHR